MTRRQFISTTAGTAAASIIPRRVLGGKGFIAPSDKINIGYVGCGSQGLRLLMPALLKPEFNIIAVCDPNRKSDDYPTWGPGELKGRIRSFLDNPGWGEGTRDGLCGLEVGLELVNRHYAKQKPSGQYSDCRAYADFREMLATEKDLDAVYVMTPEHLHATVTINAMRMGKHAICHKSMATVLHEAQVVRDTTHRSGCTTMMHCDAHLSETPMLKEWVQSGVIGQVRQVHVWTDRPYWPQGMHERPKGRPPIPDGFQWDLWLGPVPDMPYHPDYSHARFRGWYDFGSGALGDVGNIIFFKIFSILDLESPLSVEALPSRYYSLRDDTWHREVNQISFPRSSIIHWEFPARGDMAPLSLFWYDGGMRPILPDLQFQARDLQWFGGLIFIGDDGILIAGPQPRLLPDSKMRDFVPPPETLPRPMPELDQWIQSCRGGAPTLANYEHIYAQTETVIIGNIALRHEGEKLMWDSEKAVFSHGNGANKLLTREYRPGWEL